MDDATLGPAESNYTNRPSYLTSALASRCPIALYIRSMPNASKRRGGREAAAASSISLSHSCGSVAERAYHLIAVCKHQHQMPRNAASHNRCHAVASAHNYRHDAGVIEQCLGHISLAVCWRSGGSTTLYDVARHTASSLPTMPPLTTSAYIRNTISLAHRRSLCSMREGPHGFLRT